MGVPPHGRERQRAGLTVIVTDSNSVMILGEREKVALSRGKAKPIRRRATLDISGNSR